jgi:hypothetical protein
VARVRGGDLLRRLSTMGLELGPPAEEGDRSSWRLGRRGETGGGKAPEERDGGEKERLGCGRTSISQKCNTRGRQVQNADCVATTAGGAAVGFQSAFCRWRLGWGDC